MQESARGIARAAAVVAAFGVLSRILGFVREAVLSRTFGTRGDGAIQADAFVNALFLVNTFAAVLLYLLVTVVVPSFEREREMHDEDTGWRLIWTIGSWVVLFLCAVGAVAALWPEGPTALFGLDTARADLMAELLRIMAAGLALQGLSGLLTAVLHSQRRFAGPAAVGVAFNLGIILGLVIGGRSAEAAAWGVVVGAAAQILLQLPQLIGVLRRAPGRPALRHPRLHYVTTLSIPVLAASILQQINGYTDKLFANSLDVGRTAALNYANAAGSAPRTVLLFPLLAPLFPVISRMLAERRNVETARAFTRAAGVLGLVSVPLGAFLMVYPTEVARVLFGGARCDAPCVDDIAGPLRWYALAVWGAFIGYLLNRSLSAANRARDIMVATIVTVAVTVALDFALIGPMGHSGLALATALGIYLNTALTAVMLARQLPEISLARVAERQARLLACGLVGAAVALAFNPILPSADRGALAAGLLALVKGLAGGAAFLVAARFVARSELTEGVRAAAAIVRRTPKG
jgi:putative peptidoglycan lipid II flippase